MGEQDVFSTPKPEKLLARVVELASAPGELVLDSFAGSGTTAAVAHKMGRRWITIELGDHCHTHIIPRLTKVIDGHDPGGVTDTTGWKGGGGFRYYRLAPSLLERDKWGNWIINKAYNPAMLAEALCKLEGFTYAPDDAVYWAHGHSTERDFIYVTTQHLTHEQLLRLSADVGPERSLLVMCTAFRGRAEAYPNLTIYSKLIADFTPNTPKYVFKGIAEFAAEPPQVITGDNYDATLLNQLAPCRINVFNISKINSEVRGGRAPRIKRLSEYIGQSYFDYLANLEDLVLLMDESHRYRASAGVRAINELKPVLGLELTATPFTESSKGPVRFKNVVYRNSLAQAMDDGFVKEPAVVTRKDFKPADFPPAELERIKLEDGIRLHENVNVELDTYARESGRPLVTPFVLVIARDTTHAGELDALIKSDAFFGGRYKDRVIQVDSSRTGAEEEAMVERLLRVEQADDPTEIVIHVNMLKEGWDVTNLYTIVPLRAASARTLVEQSIGRGLRLPYGMRVGLTPIDRLNIVAHDRFQEIVDDANRADSPLRVQAIEIPAEELQRRVVTVESHSILDERLGMAGAAAWTDAVAGAGTDAGTNAVAGAVAGAGTVAGAGHSAAVSPLFTTDEECAVAAATVKAIEALSNRPADLPGAALLRRPEIQARLAEAVMKDHPRQQLTLEGLRESVNVARIVATVCDEVADATIDIPRVLVVPIGKVGIRPASCGN